MRLIWSRYDPTRKQVLEDAKVKYHITKLDGTLGKSYRVFYVCAACSGEFPLSDVQVDHVAEIGVMPIFPFKKGELEAWFNKLFCGADNLQVLHTECHKLKSKQDAKERAK